MKRVLTDRLVEAVIPRAAGTSVTSQQHAGHRVFIPRSSSQVRVLVRTSERLFLSALHLVKAVPKLTQTSDLLQRIDIV